MSKTVTLRDYQIECKEAVYREWDNSAQYVMAVMPTGTGKTTLFSSITQDFYHRNARILLAVHRKELVEQISNRLSEFGIYAGLIMADKPIKKNARVQCASIQTLINRKCPPADFVIIDECHPAFT